MEEVVEGDGSGRIHLPASVRRAAPWRQFRVRVEGGRIILIPLKPALERYYGIARPAAYTSAEEVDEAVKRETRKILGEDLR